jgi:cyclohexanecarboxyl-CoA dehydrogenase
MTTTQTPSPSTDELELFRESTRAFAEARLARGAHERARTEAFPADAYAQIAQQGLLGLTVPEELGGQAADVLALGIACEEIARADFNLGYLVFGSAIAADLLARYPQMAGVVGEIVSGQRIVALALTEPEAGSDANRLTTRADPVDGGWRLSGEKSSITLAPHAHSAITFARTPDGVTSFLVDLDASVGRQQFKDPGFLPLGRGALTFEGTFVPAANRLSDEGRGFHEVMHEFDLSRPLLALMCIAVAERALQMTADYVKERHAFGRPIARHQGVAFPIAEHATKLEATRWLAYRALSLRIAGRPHTKEAAMLKWWGPHVAFDAIHECVILHGHVAWSEEMPLQQMLRDVSGLEIGDGTPQIQKAIIAREILGRDYVSY